MTFPLSEDEKRYLSLIESKYENNGKFANFSDEELIEYSDVIDLLISKGILKYDDFDNANVYQYIGSFTGFRKWLDAQEIKYSISNNSSIQEYDNYFNLVKLIQSRLRQMIFTKPSKELEVQNAIEGLFVAVGFKKGNDYDRESGKFEFSGKEYIPDFVFPGFNLCIEVKLLREGKKSKVIEEINADITAYKKIYNRIIFVIYDLGEIRDEIEFKHDIENSGDSIKVIIIKQ